MNTPADDGNDNLRYAEYVLGVLDADARAAVAHEVATTSEAAVAVALWQRRLTPLADPIDEVAPAPYVWARIRDSLQLDAPDRLQPRKGLGTTCNCGAGSESAPAHWPPRCWWRCWCPARHSHRRWPTPGTWSRPSSRTTAPRLDRDHGSAERPYDRGAGDAGGIRAGRAPELWLIPAGANPIAVGMIAPDKPTTLALDAALLARLGPPPRSPSRSNRSAVRQPGSRRAGHCQGCDRRRAGCRRRQGVRHHA